MMIWATSRNVQGNTFHIAVPLLVSHRSRTIVLHHQTNKDTIRIIARARTHTHTHTHIYIYIYMRMHVRYRVLFSRLQVHYEDGMYIIRQYARGDLFYIITRGKVSDTIIPLFVY